MNALRACLASWLDIDIRRAGCTVLLPIALLAWSVRVSAQPPSAHAASRASLTMRARELGIARERAWLRLLHYFPSSGELRSQIENTAFFLAKRGADDPEAELEATLDAFQLPVVKGHEDEHALCRFPARRRLLDRRLHLDGSLGAPSCPALTQFLAKLDPESVALVYVANFLDNPASAFGHTFLRLKKRRPAGSDQSHVSDDERDHGVEYTAEVDTRNPLLYAFKGLTGLFAGVYRFHSFESKLHEYANAEARDLWEYDLNLTEPEVRLLTLHLWELSTASLDYYYLTKNCSYHALATIEAAVPRVELVSRLNFVVIPRDTVKALFAVPGLVGGVTYRPSLRSQFRSQVARLNTAQREMVQTLTLDPSAPLPPAFTLRESVTTLDVAKLVLEARFSRSLEMADGERPDPRVQAARVLLAGRRARLSATLPAPAFGPLPHDKSPELAHGSMRVTLGTGVTSQYGSGLYTAGYRLALHDLTDPADGEPELSQLQFLDTRVRYDLGERSLTLDRLTFAELVALTPITRYEHALSWRGRAFGMRLHDSACRDCFAHGVEVGLGATLATDDERLAIFVMADAHVAFSSKVDGIDGSFVRLGLGPYAGVRARLFGNATGLLTAGWSYLPWQSLRGTYDVRATVKNELGQDVAVGVEGAMQPESLEMIFASYLYF